MTDREFEKQTYDLRLEGVFREAWELSRMQKTNDYGETWKRLGLLGQYVKIFIKEGRLRQLIWNNKEAKVKNESLRDTLLDLIVYAGYAVICYDEGNITGEDACRKALIQMLDELLQRGVDEDWLVDVNVFQRIVTYKEGSKHE